MSELQGNFFQAEKNKNHSDGKTQIYRIIYFLNHLKVMIKDIMPFSSSINAIIMVVIIFKT